MLIKYVNNQPPLDSMTFGRINCNLQQCVVILRKKQQRMSRKQMQQNQLPGIQLGWEYTITLLLHYCSQHKKFVLHIMFNTMFRSETSSKNLFSEHDSTSTVISYCFYSMSVLWFIYLYMKHLYLLHRKRYTQILTRREAAP